MEKIPFGYSIHPGEILKTEFMEPLGLSSYRLAKELHVSAPRVNDIVLGKRGSPPTPLCASAPTSATPPSSGLACRWTTISGSPRRDKSLAKVKPRAQAA